MSIKIIFGRRIPWLGINLFSFSILILVIGTGIIPASQNNDNIEPYFIDPAVYITLEQEGVAQVLVILKEQADLSAAITLESKADKGAFVYQQLTNVANQTQKPLQTFHVSMSVV